MIEKVFRTLAIARMPADAADCTSDAGRKAVAVCHQVIESDFNAFLAKVADNCETPLTVGSLKAAIKSGGEYIEFWVSPNTGRIGYRPGIAPQINEMKDYSFCMFQGIFLLENPSDSDVYKFYLAADDAGKEMIIFKTPDASGYYDVTNTYP